MSDKQEKYPAIRVFAIAAITLRAIPFAGQKRRTYHYLDKSEREASAALHLANTVLRPARSTCGKWSILPVQTDKTGQAARTVRRKIQVANNLTPEATEIAKKEGITFRDALKLSHLKPEQQVEAASLLADGKIHKVDEYTAAQSEAEQTEAEPDAPPFRIAERQFDTFAEGVADLKDTTKDFRCTP